MYCINVYMCTVFVVLKKLCRREMLVRTVKISYKSCKTQ
jgi:hypothetical protein